MSVKAVIVGSLLIAVSVGAGIFVAYDPEMKVIGAYFGLLIVMLVIIVLVGSNVLEDMRRERPSDRTR